MIIQVLFYLETMEVLMKKNGLKLGFCWLPFYGKPKKIDAFSKIHHWLVVDLPL